ncbi:hypothetical protein PRUB_a3917 [Pseudoalteromonas rubra]|uniref:Uncharacterized protein n=1 Tax=Pseudoalteromonas rubra TaxID=43658 RepID=A0A8T0CAP4_9GAMM|nr:hypothetical protein PRUB_a3917 [Pseudoalteromonas rubra]
MQFLTLKRFASAGAEVARVPKAPITSAVFMNSLMCDMVFSSTVFVLGDMSCGTQQAYKSRVAGAFN